jgi:hypothetical protein
MDQATVERILARQGAQPTPENVNRIMEFAASDPSILERYSMGTAPSQMETGPTGRRDIRGSSGLDDNAALLNLNRSIDNSIRKTDNPPPIVQGDQPQPLTARVAPRAAPKQTPSDPGRDVPPHRTPTGMPQDNSLPSDPITMGSTGYSGGGDPRVPNQITPPGSSGLEWLLPSIAAIFGVRSAMPGGGGARAPDVKTPQSGVPDNSGAGPPTPTPEQQKGTIYAGPPEPQRQLPPPSPGNRPPPDPAQVARVQAQIDAENAARAAQLQEQMRVRQAQQGTSETLRAANAATRPRPKLRK